MASIKQEPVDKNEVERRFLELCAQNPKGITFNVIQNDMRQIEGRVHVEIINRLSTQHKIEIFQTKNNELLYRLKTPSTAASSKTVDGDHHEKLIYQIIEEAGTKGILFQDIQRKSGLKAKPLITKKLSALETKKLIKSVTPVSAAKKKAYLLFGLEPDRSLTGGSFYSGQDFDSEFVDILNAQCYRFLEEKAMTAQKMKLEPYIERQNSFASSKDVWKYITDLRLITHQLPIDDIESILDSLVYDGKVVKSIVASGAHGGEQTKLYRSVPPPIQSTRLMAMPCGQCPLLNECHVGGPISPTTCVYMKSWLEY